VRKLIIHLQKNLEHKISFWKLKNLKDIVQKYGLTFLTILIFIEIVEHVGGIFLIRWLGVNVHEYFNAFLPAPFLICFHWISAPIVFFIYMKIKKK
tara:strand:+ start:8880 stop:9167 length:288 start_codon:yes stop_codon:yes gene_type:complete